MRARVAAVLWVSIARCVEDMHARTNPVNIPGRRMRNGTSTSLCRVNEGLSQLSPPAVTTSRRHRPAADANNGRRALVWLGSDDDDDDDVWGPLPARRTADQMTTSGATAHTNGTIISQE